MENLRNQRIQWEKKRLQTAGGYQHPSAGGQKEEVILLQPKLGISCWWKLEPQPDLWKELKKREDAASTRAVTWVKNGGKEIPWPLPSSHPPIGHNFHQWNRKAVNYSLQSPASEKQSRARQEEGRDLTADGPAPTLKETWITFCLRLCISQGELRYAATTKMPLMSVA